MARQDSQLNRGLTLALLGVEQEDPYLQRIWRFGRAITGLEDHPFLHGARNFALPVMLARPVRLLAEVVGAGEQDESFLGSIVFILGYRDGIPSKVRLRELSLEAIDALGNADASIDGEELFLRPENGGTNTLWRTVRAGFAKPEAVFSAWGLADSDWVRAGIVQSFFSIDSPMDGRAGVEVKYQNRVVSKLSERDYPAFQYELGLIGCERMDVQIGLLASESTDPLRYQAIEMGLMRPDQHGIFIIVSPALSGLLHIVGGPGMNNALGHSIEKVVADSMTPHSVGSLEIASIIMEAYASGDGEGSFEKLPLNCWGGIIPAFCCMRHLIEGTWISEGIAETHTELQGQMLAMWLVGIFAKDRGTGEALVAALVKERESGAEKTLVSSCKAGGVPELWYLELKDGEEKLRVRVLDGNE
jgi:hypothetical protein